MKKLSIGLFLILINCVSTFADEVKISGAISELNNNQKLFVEEYIKAVNSDAIGNRKQLIHPKCLTCITEETKEFFDDLFLRRLNENIPSEYTIYIKEINSNENLPFGDYFTYPVIPTHLIQISYEHGKNNLMIFAINQNGQYFEVLQCPKPEFIKNYREEKIKTEIKKEKQGSKVKELFLELKDPLRSELKDLLNQGKKVQAIKKYCVERGESLTIAKDVVELLESENEGNGGQVSIINKIIDNKR